MWKKVKHDFMNVRHIFPTQQQDVFDMINHCKNDDNIKKIIIFGSSVTEACNPWSDIDIYFELEHNTDNLPAYKSETTVFDKWSNFSVSPKLLQEIKNTGVVVYEK